jgi:oligoendopeptidase F
LSLQKDLPAILARMGFPEEEAYYIGTHAVVRPIRGGGYSDQPPMRGDTALMTTVFNPDGLDYKAYRIAMHELGHVVCGVYSTKEVDHSMLADVPTGGITEGMAEMLAYKNIEGLGLAKGSFGDQKQLLALASLWYMLDLGGQSLTEIETWKWMYAHPGATPEELKTAVLEISASIWNQYYSPVFGGIRDQHILSIYNHFITGSLYLFNYFVGNVVMFQLYDAFMPDNLAGGLKKACSEGNTLPGLWMKNAVGKEISVDPLLNAAHEAVKNLSRQH